MADDAIHEINTLLEHVSKWNADIKKLLEDIDKRRAQSLHGIEDTAFPTVKRRRSSVPSMFSGSVDLDTAGGNAGFVGKTDNACPVEGMTVVDSQGGSKEVGEDDAVSQSRQAATTGSSHIAGGKSPVEVETVSHPLPAEESETQPHLPDLTSSPISQARQRKRKLSFQWSDDDVRAHSKYRCRRVAVVYYDGDAQKCLDSLVKQVATTRHAIRRASVTLEQSAYRPASDASEANGSDFDGRRGRPVLEYKSASMRNRKPPDHEGQHDAGLKLIDSCLEKSQTFCERAAFQLLREGNCVKDLNDAMSEIAKAKEAGETQLPALRERALNSIDDVRGRVKERSRPGVMGGTMSKADGAASSASPVPSLVSSLPSDAKLEADLDVDPDDGDGEDFDADTFDIGQYDFRKARILAH